MQRSVSYVRLSGLIVAIEFKETKLGNLLYYVTESAVRPRTVIVTPVKAFTIFEILNIDGNPEVTLLESLHDFHIRFSNDSKLYHVGKKNAWLFN